MMWMPAHILMFNLPNMDLAPNGPLGNTLLSGSSGFRMSNKLLPQRSKVDLIDISAMDRFVKAVCVQPRS